MTVKLFICVGLLLLAFTSTAISAWSLNSQNGLANWRSRPETVVTFNVRETNQATSDECVDVEETESCVTEPDNERPEASFCFIANDLICADCKRGKELSTPVPSYPVTATAARVSGRVVIEVVIDESGKVVWAVVVKGHPLLRETALRAACQRTFEPYTCSGRGIKVVEHLVYAFNLS